MNRETLVAEILKESDYINVLSAFKDAPCYHGIYIIKINELKRLPQEIIIHQQRFSKVENIIYIGKAEKQTILERLVFQELGNNRGVFFRKLGSVLGIAALPNTTKNFKFELEQRKWLIQWMRENLKVKYFKCSIELEPLLIKEFSPAFNYDDNDHKCNFVTEKYRENKKIGK